MQARLLGLMESPDPKVRESAHRELENLVLHFVEQNTEGRNTIDQKAVLLAFKHISHCYHVKCSELWVELHQRFCLAIRPPITEQVAVDHESYCAGEEAPCDIIPWVQETCEDPETCALLHSEQKPQGRFAPGYITQ